MKSDIEMNRVDQTKHNLLIIRKISGMLTNRYRRPNYRTVCRLLNDNEVTTSVGNAWTERSIYRMLQRSGYSGLWGLQGCYLNN